MKNQMMNRLSFLLILSESKGTHTITRNRKGPPSDWAKETLPSESPRVRGESGGDTMRIYSTVNQSGGLGVR
jgi:hypothetical protein